MIASLTCVSSGQESTALALTGPGWKHERSAMCETQWTSSSPTAISRQQLVQGDRQVADANARGVIDGVGNRSGGAGRARFPKSPPAPWGGHQMPPLRPGH